MYFVDLRIFAPPGATFLPNPRSTVDSSQTVTSGKITKSSMFERVVERVPNRLQGSPSHCGLPESCTEGFWSQIPRTTISWSCWSTLKCVTHLNFRDLAKIGQNHDFGQNLKIFFVLVAVNHYKRSLLPLGFV